MFESFFFKFCILHICILFTYIYVYYLTDFIKEGWGGGDKRHTPQKYSTYLLDIVYLIG